MNLDVVDLSYDEINNYFNLYTEKNVILEKLIEENTKNYNFDSNYQKYFRDSTTLISKALMEKYNLIFTINSLIKKNIFAYCYETKKEYKCDKISYSKMGQNFFYYYIFYHFNSLENEFILCLNWEYFVPSFIYYPKTNKVYNLNYRIDKLQNINFEIGLLNNADKIVKYNNNFKYCIGIIDNSGHYLWNEIFGFIYLYENNLINKDTEFIIGNRDYLNFGKILQEKGYNVTYIDKLEKLEFPTINTIKIFINDKLPNLLKNYINISENNSDKIKLCFDIRTNSRVCINEKFMIIHMINHLINKKYIDNFEIYLSGWLTFNTEKNSLIKKNIKEQNDIYNYIQKKFPKIKINNLIGKKYSEIIKSPYIFDIVISNDGPGINYYNKILFDGYHISYTNQKSVKAFSEQIFFFKKKINLVYIKSVKDIIDNDTNTNFSLYNYNDFSIEFQKQLEFFNYEKFKKKYGDFDSKYYYDFNNLNIENSEYKLLEHYDKIGYHSNKTYDFNSEVNDFIGKYKKDYEKFYTDNLLWRNISYEELKNKINKYYIYNKESFYNVYSDFDISYYKKKYFNDIEISDYEIEKHYHLHGKKMGYLTNDKIKIIIYTRPLDINCGGVLILHYLAYLINTTEKNIYAKLFNIYNFRYKNMFCNDFALEDEVNENTIVLYPEVVKNNVLNSKNVIRWILLDFDIETPITILDNWGLKLSSNGYIESQISSINNVVNLIYGWESKKCYKTLKIPWLNPLFIYKNDLYKRNNTCYLIKKGYLLHKKMTFFHNDKSIFLDKIINLEKISDIFKKCKFFYCYDLNTMYIIFSVLCGCPVIIHPKDGISKEEYFNNFYLVNDEIFDYGIAYGNSPEEVNHALKTVNIGRTKFIEYFDSFKKKYYNNFINDIKNFFINKII